MGKGHYRGGSTLFGHGTIAKAKGRTGGIGDASGRAVREQQREAERLRRQKLADEVRENQRKLRQLGKQWSQEKGRKQYERLVREDRAKSSPLAAALHAAILRVDAGED